MRDAWNLRVTFYCLLTPECVPAAPKLESDLSSHNFNPLSARTTNFKPHVHEKNQPRIEPLFIVSTVRFSPSWGRSCMSKYNHGPMACYIKMNVLPTKETKFKQNRRSTIEFCTISTLYSISAKCYRVNLSLVTYLDHEFLVFQCTIRKWYLAWQFTSSDDYTISEHSRIFAYKNVV